MSRLAITRFTSVLLLIAALSLSYSIAAGQENQSPNPPPPPITAGEQRREGRPFATLEEEMRAKRAIHFANKAHKDNLTRARDLAILGASLADAFKEKKHFDRQDFKMLEKAEKLTKSIRDAFGGSTEEELIERPPTDLADAMSQLAELTDSLKEKVEKTPKRVVSAAVIDEANVLLELIRIVKKMTKT